MRSKTERNVILIGMAGAGKSTLGVLLAKALGKDFVDTDILIQRQEGCLLPELIKRKGVGGFFALEEAVVSAADLRSCVVATGGSVVYSARAMEKLKSNGTVIYLSLPYEEIQRRVTGITTRGIVMRRGRSLRDAYEERLPLYHRYSDITLDCAGKDIETCVSEMVERLNAL